MQPNNPLKPNDHNSGGTNSYGNKHRPTTDGFTTLNNHVDPKMNIVAPDFPNQGNNVIASNQAQIINDVGKNPSNFNNQPNPIETNESYANFVEESSLSDGTKSGIKNTIFTIALFIMAPLFAVFMILFVFQSYVVDGSSMEPTLQNGDRVFILKLPKSMANIKKQQWVPARNEIIVFKKPYNEGTQLIKRVIGLPGDKVVIKDGEITIYNIDNPQGFHPDEGTDYKGTLAIYESEQNMEANVGQGEIFVLGDNRTPGGSLDSHSGLGLVPIDHIVGRLWIRYFPLSGFKVYATILNKTKLAFDYI